jgi:hypothetical protein
MSPSGSRASTDDMSVLGSVDLLLLVQRMVSRTAVPPPRSHNSNNEVADGT